MPQNYRICDGLSCDIPPASVTRPCHSSLITRHCSLMALATLGEGPLRHRQDNRKVSHGHENVAVIKEPTPQSSHAVHLRAMPCGGNAGPSRRARAGAKSR